MKSTPYVTCIRRDEMVILSDGQRKRVGGR